MAIRKQVLKKRNELFREFVMDDGRLEVILLALQHGLKLDLTSQLMDFYADNYDIEQKLDPTVEELLRSLDDE